MYSNRYKSFKIFGNNISYFLLEFFRNLNNHKRQKSKVAQNQILQKLVIEQNYYLIFIFLLVYDLPYWGHLLLSSVCVQSICTKYAWPLCLLVYWIEYRQPDRTKKGHFLVKWIWKICGFIFIRIRPGQWPF